MLRTVSLGFHYVAPGDDKALTFLTHQARLDLKLDKDAMAETEFQCVLNAIDFKTRFCPQDVS